MSGVEPGQLVTELFLQGVVGVVAAVVLQPLAGQPPQLQLWSAAVELAAAVAAVPAAVAAVPAAAVADVVAAAAGSDVAATWYD